MGQRPRQGERNDGWQIPSTTHNGRCREIGAALQIDGQGLALSTNRMHILVGGANMKTIGLFLALSFLLIVPGASAAICDSMLNFGRIEKIEVRQPPVGRSGANGGTLFRLKGPDHVALSSNTGYYFIPFTHISPNSEVLYTAMHYLLIEAAKEGWTIRITTSNCDTPSDLAVVANMSIDF